MNFLSAQWKNLLIANYSVDPEVLRPFVPQGTTIDIFEGHVFLSLVAFLFDETRVLGIPIPFHRKFEEVNLRFYVTPDKDRSIRAVTFIKEIVPKPVANTLFCENYISMPMDHGIDGKKYWYSWGSTCQNIFAVKLDSELLFPPKGSMGEFITEHYWGYSKGQKCTLEYRVEHPQWKCCEIKDFEITVDFNDVYGSEFSFLNTQRPFNVQYAEGSTVTVSFPKRIFIK